ncbi:MAG TPA: hypothetical protein VIJ38_15175 [Acidobacteriaceae bacterium]
MDLQRFIAGLLNKNFLSCVLIEDGVIPDLVSTDLSSGIHSKAKAKAASDRLCFCQVQDLHRPRAMKVGTCKLIGRLEQAANRIIHFQVENQAVDHPSSQLFESIIPSLPNDALPAKVEDLK